MSRCARLLAAVLGVFILLLLTVGIPAPARAGSDTITPLSTAIRAAHFAEPLTRTAPTGIAEDQALLLALADYNKRAAPDDVGALTGFLKDYPHSGWAPALQTNLGITYLHYGYFSRALDAWEQAWQEGRNATEPSAKALVDGAIGRLAELDTDLGHTKRLAALLQEIAHRPVAGSATEAVQTAAETLPLVGNKDYHLFNCGPEALRALLLSLGAKAKELDFLGFYHAGEDGTSLAEVAHLADKAKLQYRLTFRTPGQPVPMPAVVHWKVGHFGAIVAMAHGLYHVKDSALPGGELWITPAALDAEASGYFLVPAQVPAAAGWRAVTDSEAEGVGGRAGPTRRSQDRSGWTRRRTALLPGRACAATTSANRPSA